MNQSKPPSENVCWSFQDPFQTRTAREIKLELVPEARGSDRETTQRETEGERGHVAFFLRTQHLLLWSPCFQRTPSALIKLL